MIVYKNSYLGHNYTSFSIFIFTKRLFP